MKQSLQLKLGQQLTMTPQLQQAIKLLQLSTLDLQHEIQEALDTNPMLEVTEDGPEEDTEAATNDASTTSPADTDTTAAKNDAGEGVTEIDTDNWEQSLPDDLPVDTQWEDLLPSASAPMAQPIENSDTDFDYRNASQESLQDKLLWQLNLTRLSDLDRSIAHAIIDSTDANGRLTQTIEEIHQSLTEQLDDVELDEAVAVLHRLQQFEPSGVCTHDLQECLLVQLQQLPPDTPWLAQAKHLVSRHIHQIGNGDYNQILRRSKLTENELSHVLSLIQTLDPYPGQLVGSDDTQYVVPDVYVTKRSDRWVVELNPDIAPKLRINTDYAQLIKRADNSSDNNFLRDNLQEARWFLKSLQSRNETLMKVASKIVEHQRGFLEHGEEAMKPLVLHDIAEAVEMHESTISRVTTQKYMHTPRGVFELKYFFSSHVSTDSGGECSSTAIRAIIKKLVAAESPRKPLSDSKISLLLGEQGIQVARRTIAKYRDALHIPPSNERKRLM